MDKGGTCLPWECCKVLCALVFTVKRSIDQLFMHYFHNLSSVYGALPETPQGSITGPRWGTFVSRPPNLPIPGKKSCRRTRMVIYYTHIHLFIRRMTSKLIGCLGTAYCTCHGCRVYVNGVNVNSMALYPPVELPVSPSTPMLSSLVRWDHSDSWRVPTVEQFLARSANNSASSVEVDVSSPDSNDAYLSGHVIDGRVLFPATGYLVLAWRQLARMIGQTYQHTPVCFDDVHIHRATILPSAGKSVVHRMSPLK